MDERERVIRKWIKEQVMRAGRSEWFADQAGDYPELFKGNVTAFVAAVDARISHEEKIEDRPRGAIGAAGSSMDRGVKRAEKDYTGDVLTHWGYDIDTEGHRW